MGGKETSMKDNYNITITLLYFSEETVILITVHRQDVNDEISVVHRQLRSALLQILQNRYPDITISRFGNDS